MSVGRHRFVAAAVAAALPLALAGCGADPSTGLSASAGTPAPVPSTAPAATTPVPPVNSAMTSDAEALSGAASQFDSVANDLKSSIGQVDSTASELAAVLTGPEGAAAQAAFLRFREAANKEVQLLNDISQNINQAGVQYQAAADDAAASLSGSMGFSVRPIRLQAPTQEPADDELKYNFGGIEGAASQVQGQVSQVQGLLDEGRQAVLKLSSIWGGSGSEAFQVELQRWDSTASELNAALSDLSNKVAQAGAGMQETEKGISGMFG